MKCAVCGKETDKSKAMYCSICGTAVCENCAKRKTVCDFDHGEYFFYN